MGLWSCYLFRQDYVKSLMKYLVCSQMRAVNEFVMCKYTNLFIINEVFLKVFVWRVINVLHFILCLSKTTKTQTNHCQNCFHYTCTRLLHLPLNFNEEDMFRGSHCDLVYSNTHLTTHQMWYFRWIQDH